MGKRREGEPPNPACVALVRRNQYIGDNIGLVKPIALRLWNQCPHGCHELEDFISAGVLGLIDAAARYTRALNVPFSAYARYRIRGAILDAMRKGARSKVYVWPHQLRPLSEAAAVPSAGSATPEKVIEIRQTHERLEAAAAELTPRERMFLEMRYREGMPVTEIAAALNITRNSATRLHRLALDKMRAALERGGIRRAA